MVTKIATLILKYSGSKTFRNKKSTLTMISLLKGSAQQQQQYILTWYISMAEKEGKTAEKNQFHLTSLLLLSCIWKLPQTAYFLSFIAFQITIIKETILNQNLTISLFHCSFHVVQKEFIITYVQSQNIYWTHFRAYAPIQNLLYAFDNCQNLKPNLQETELQSSSEIHRANLLLETPKNNA